MKDLKEMLGEFNQIGIVVRDLEPIKKTMKEMYGAEPRDEGPQAHKGDQFFRGEPSDFTVHIIYYNVFDVEIEYFQPIEGDSPWQETLDEYGEGMIQHVRFDVMDYDEVADYFKDNYGIEPYYWGGGEIYGGIKFGYFDTREILGYITEVINFKGIYGKKAANA